MNSLAQPFVLDFEPQLIEYDTTHLEECEETDTLRSAIVRTRSMLRGRFASRIGEIAWMIDRQPDFTIHPGFIIVAPKQADPVADPRFRILWEDHFKPAAEKFAACLTDEAYFGQEVEQWVHIIRQEKQDHAEWRKGQGW